MFGLAKAAPGFFGGFSRKKPTSTIIDNKPQYCKKSVYESGINNDGQKANPVLLLLRPLIVLAGQEMQWPLL